MRVMPHAESRSVIKSDTVDMATSIAKREEVQRRDREAQVIRRTTSHRRAGARHFTRYNSGMKDLLAQLIHGTPLTSAQTESAFSDIMDGTADPAQTASLLTLLAAREPTV